MRRFWIWRALKIALFVALGLLLFGFLTQHLWNWLMPSIFGLKRVTFRQALGLVVLSKILLGGIHKHSPGRSEWKRRMEERWGQMSPEERERLRSRLKQRCASASGFAWNPPEPWVRPEPDQETRQDESLL